MKKNIFQEVGKLNLPNNSYVVVGSGVMTAHGIREYGDIDIIVNEIGWKLLLEKGWQKSPISHRKGDMLWKEGEETEIFNDFRYGSINLTFEDLAEETELIHDIPFISLRKLIDFKQAIGREKDFKDIALIEEYLQKNNSR